MGDALPGIEEICSYIREVRIGGKMLDYLGTLNLQYQAFRDGRGVGVCGALLLPETLAVPRFHARLYSRLGDNLCITSIAYVASRDCDEVLFRMLLGNGRPRMVDGTRQYASEALITRYGIESLNGYVFGGDDLRSVPTELLRPSAYFLQKVEEACAGIRE
jgi:hypothetical protein